MKVNVIPAILSLFISMSSIAQQTGEFVASIPFEGGTRDLAYSVPANYSGSNQYSLVIGLHGCGGNEVQTRNTLSFLTGNLNAIVVCPEGPGTNAGFMGDSGLNEWDIVTTLINEVTANYAIDASNVFLWGFSCNGFAAAETGMSNIYPFKGIIPFNPALDASYFSQDLVDFNNGTKTCLCAGTADFGFLQMERYRDSLISNGSDHLWNEMQGINHTTSFPTFESEMMECFNYFDPSLSVASLEGNVEFSVYPNPFDDEFTIQIEEGSSLFSGMIQVEIVDVLGQLVASYEVLPSNGEIHLENTLNKGVYMMSLTRGNVNSKIQVVKQ